MPVMLNLENELIRISPKNSKHIEYSLITDKLGICVFKAIKPEYFTILQTAERSF